MEYKFEKNKMDLQVLRDFCEREGEAVEYRKGDRLEREEARPKVKEYITWFSFEGEFAGDYPTFLYGQPSQTTIEAMMPSRVLRVTGQQLEQYFDQSIETMKLRAVIAEHILFQFLSRYLDLHCATARERYELLLQRCPGIVEHLDLQDLASFLCITPNYLSTIRK